MSRYFNPRPPQGERRSYLRAMRVLCSFQSTPPARGVTGAHLEKGEGRFISIHAPRKGSDRNATGTYHRMVTHFNPRPPQGERLFYRFPENFIKIISIHAPRKGSDFNFAKSAKDKDKFQSTPPARGATFPAAINTLHSQYFNPRPPQGERRSRNFKAVRLYHFNPRPPQGERQERRGQR